jgi:Tol biopolymer transport system component
MFLRSLLTAAGVFAALALTAPAPAAAQQATRVVEPNGAEGNGPVYFAATSSNGRWVVFSSDATNLVPNDTNGKTDVFRLDRQTGEIRRVSVNDDGVQADGRSFASGVSKDGRLVLFWSHASNLVANDTNAQPDVFIYDTVLHTPTRLSNALYGYQADGASRFPTMSEDGRWVAFVSTAWNIVDGDNNDLQDVFLLDRRTGLTTRIGQPAFGETNDDSGGAEITPNGRYVAFETRASNLVAGDTNGRIDGFVVDVARNTTTCVSVNDDGIIGNAESRSPIVSSNGRWVSFSSLATNLVAGDTNATSDSFIRDMRRGTIRRISVRNDGVQADGGSDRGVFDASSRYVAFSSIASNLVTGQTDTNNVLDVYVHDLSRGRMVRVSRAHDGGEPNAWSGPVAFAGRTLFLSSPASNFVPNDTNGAEDIFAVRWRCSFVARTTRPGRDVSRPGRFAYGAVARRWVEGSSLPRPVAAATFQVAPPRHRPARRGPHKEVASWLLDGYSPLPVSSWP